jgi:lysozyme
MTAKFLKGIDVSMHQGVIDWAKVKTAGIDFAYIKATEGRTYVDPFFYANWEAAKAAGIARGAYLYLRFDRPAADQANNFCTSVRLEPGDLLPVIDVEDERGGVNAAVLDQVHDHIVSELHVPAMIYTMPAFWQKYGTGPDWDFSEAPLWIAHWGVKAPKVPKPWRAWTVWQHSADGKVPGIVGNVDLNCLAGSLNDIRVAANIAPETEAA